MITFVETPLPGLCVLQSEKAQDARGYFIRLYGRQDFAAQKIDFTPQQNSLSHNSLAGTLRGMHFQRGGAAEHKLVTCLKGRIYDVAIDLRKESSTHKKWFCAELSPDNGLSLLIPRGFAHGFITLEDDTDVLYQIDGTYDAAAASGLRWNDPAINIKWPREPAVIAERDKEWPAYAG
jgi:dTDP-4-dehydrorhamnose 3,5-epimerase